MSLVNDDPITRPSSSPESKVLSGPTEEAPSSPGEQPTLVTGDPSLVQPFGYASTPEFLGGIFSKKSPYADLLKWGGPVLLVSFFFMIWTLVNHSRQQRHLESVSYANGLLLDASDALTHQRLDEAATHIEKLLVEFPDHERLSTLMADIKQRIAQRDEQRREGRQTGARRRSKR